MMRGAHWLQQIALRSTIGEDIRVPEGVDQAGLVRGNGMQRTKLWTKRN